jgi:hypothetical protein
VTCANQMATSNVGASACLSACPTTERHDKSIDEQVTACFTRIDFLFGNDRAVCQTDITELIQHTNQPRGVT